MKVTYYKNSIRCRVIASSSDVTDLDGVLEKVLGRFPKARVLVNGNQFKWLQLGNRRILISAD